jgi:hypothetical protein
VKLKLMTFLLGGIIGSSIIACATSCEDEFEEGDLCSEESFYRVEAEKENKFDKDGISETFFPVVLRPTEPVAVCPTPHIISEKPITLTRA